MMVRWPAAVVLAAGLLVAQGCAVNPVTGNKELGFVSESQELAIGSKNYMPYRQAQGGDYVADPAVARYVDRVGQRLAAVSDRKLPYEFRVLNDSTPNAWALPGGKIAINRGLLVELQSEAELAAVLAHEIVHAAARHSAQSIERGTLLQGALIVPARRWAVPSTARSACSAPGSGPSSINQKYGRDDESEADHYGIRYMVRAGYDPQAAVRLQETFVRLAEGKEAGWLDGLFASHPPSRQRVEANRRLVAQLGNPGGETGEDRYRREMARLVQTRPAYDGYEEARKALADGRQSEALRLVDAAIALEPKEAAFRSLRGEILAAGGDAQAALHELDRAVALNPDHFRPLLLRGVARREAGDLDGATKDLARSVELLPTAEGYVGLGRVARLRGRDDLAAGYFRRAASGGGETAREARRELAGLALAVDPVRELEARVGLSRDGYLLVEVRNPSETLVDDVRVLVGRRAGGRIVDGREIRLPRTLPGGRALSVKTDIGPLDPGVVQRYGAVVTQARRR
jgi:beta-barrel assembly-enhancing protease